MKYASTMLALAFACSPAFAAGTAADRIAAVEPYVRLVPPGQDISAAFMVFKNADDRDHRVVKAESAAAKATELHTHVSEGGMMKMRPVAIIEIKAKGETALKPGGLHMMLIGLKHALKEGDLVPITVTFEDGSSEKVEAPVRRIEETMPMDPGHGNMMH